MELGAPERLFQFLDPTRPNLDGVVGGGYFPDGDLRIAALRACTIMRWNTEDLQPPQHMDFSDCALQPADISDTVGRLEGVLGMVGSGMGGDLTEFTTLRSLNLSKTSVVSHPRGPASLAALTGLETLELRDSNLNDKGLATLCGALVNLVELDLDSCGKAP